MPASCPCGVSGGGRLPSPLVSAMIVRPCEAATLLSSCLVRYELIAAVVSTLITTLTTATSSTIAAATRTLSERTANPRLDLMTPACAPSPGTPSGFPGTLL